MIKAVVFDLDHTLYDRDATYEKMGAAFKHAFGDYLNEDVPHERIVKCLQNADRSGIYNDGWRGIYQDTVATGIFRKTPDYEMYYDFIKRCFPLTITLYADTLPTLLKLRALGYALAILTNGPSEYQHSKVNALGIAPYVDHVVVGGDIGANKPSPIPFKLVCRMLHCDAGEVVYVGDNPLNDVVGARECGLIPIWMRSVGTWPAQVEPAAYSIKALGELPDLLTAIDAGNTCEQADTP